MNVNPFADQGNEDRFNYSKMSNEIIDRIMPRLTGNAWKILSYFTRWRQLNPSAESPPTYREIKHGTGILSDETIKSCLSELNDHGFEFSEEDNHER